MRVSLSCLVLWAMACTAPEAEPVDTDTDTDTVEAEPAPPEWTDWFTLAVIPDIQFMTLDTVPDLLTPMMQDIVDRRHTDHIAMVLQEGDITHDNTEAEWQAADGAFSMLEEAGIPYVVCVGNHDMEGDRDTARYNQWFGVDRLQQQDTYLASASTTQSDDHAHVFRAGGLDWIVLSLAYDPTDEALAWGADLVRAHPDHRVIVLTHAYLSPSATTASEGQGIQDQIVDPFPNVLFVFNGHFIGGTAAHRRRARQDGSEVAEVFANYQTQPLSGSARTRRVRIAPEDGRVDITACDPFGWCSRQEADNITLEDFVR